MSYWAATVITNLLSAIPLVGGVVVEWVWGGFAVSNATLVRFYTLHFLLPFLVAVLVVLHLVFLHLRGRCNPLGTPSWSNNVPFHYYFRAKDLFVFFVFLFVFLCTTLVYGYDLMDAENWIPANSLVTPAHIQPEWYFLFAYAILRAIPNKLGGVLGLVGAVMCLFLFSIFTGNSNFRGFHSSPIARLFFWTFVVVFGLLTWLGACPAELPYSGVASVLTVVYFLLVVAMAIWPLLSNTTRLARASHNPVDYELRKGAFRNMS